MLLKITLSRLVFVLAAVFLLSASSKAGARDTVRICAYNILNYDGSDATTRDPYFRASLHAMNPDLLIVEEMANQNAANTFTSDVMNYYEAGVYSTTPYHDGPDTNPQIFYKGTKVTLLSINWISTDLRDIGEFIVTFIGTTDTVHIFDVHLKADEGSPFDAQRGAEATVLRNYMNNLPANTKFMVIGDFNTYYSTEPCLVNLEANGSNNNGQIKDPLNAVGDWHVNPAFATIHTESPRTRSFGGGATGGMNDRFDLILTCMSTLDSNIVLSRYTPYGNDGYHFNDSINRLPNYAVPDSVANGLEYGSDHLPIFCDFAFGNHLYISPFSLLTPANNAVNQSSSGTLTWNAASQATKYDVYLDQNSSPATLVSSGQTDTSFTYTHLAFATTYHWKVVARNDSGTLAAPNGPFTFTTGTPVFDISTNSVLYGTVYEGMSVPETVMVSNGGNAPLSVDSVRSNNSQFTASPASALVPPSSSLPFLLYFSPTATGGQNAAYKFYYNVSGSPFTVNASGAGAQYTITATASAGGLISPSGTVHVNYGSNNTFTMTPNTGYHVDSLLVDGVNAGAVTSYAFNATSASHTIASYFSRNQYTITASAGSNGSISPLGTQTVLYGDSAAYTITASGPDHISDVVVDGISVGAVSSYKFSSIAANHTIVASFTLNGYTITALAEANGAISPSGPVAVSSGEDTTFTITPNTGYLVDSVYVDGAYAGSPSSYPFNNISANHTIKATFRIMQFTISVSGGTNGVVAPSGSFTVTYGMDTTISITPNTGYLIDSVFVDGSYSGTPSSYKFSSITASHTLTAKFRIQTFTITESSGPNGGASPSGVVTVNYDGDTSFTFTPSYGFRIDTVLVDGSFVGMPSSYAFNNVKANHTLYVAFQQITYIIAAYAGPNGTITPGGAVVVNYGADQAFAITPAAGYHTDSVVVDGVNVGVIIADTFHTVLTNHAISASFSITSYPLNVTVVGGGNVVKAPNQSTYPYGTVVSLTATPNLGYAFTGWTQDTTSSPDTLTVTIVGTKNLTATFTAVSLFQAGISSIAFDSVLVGNAKADSFYVKNIGAAVLNLTSIGVKTSSFSVSPSSAAVPPGDSIMLIASFAPFASGAVVDTISIVNNAEAMPDLLPLSGYGSLLNISVSLVANWNMISNPVTTTLDSVHQLFPTSTIGAAFAFDSAGYAAAGILANRAGYWDKFGPAQTAVLAGVQRRADTLAVVKGWNMIGSISYPVPVSNVVASHTNVRSQYFGYAGGYSASDTLVPGKGYWVEVDSAGTLEIASAGPRAQAKPAATASKFAAMNTLVIGDADGHVQSMYIDPIVKAQAVPTQYDLPPVPPAGVFDARFVSQKYVESFDPASSNEQTFPVHISSAHYPVTVSFQAMSALKNQVVLKDALGNTIATFAKGATAAVKISDAKMNTFSLTILNVPKKFALDQNYPNPFNPVSNIRFELPVDSRVTLSVYDILGRRVQTLVAGAVEEAGVHEVRFSGANLASGVYFYRISATPVAGSGAVFTQVRKMVLIK